MNFGDVYDHIVKLQNHPANADQDHLTCCFFFSTEAQWDNHVAKLQRKIDNYRVEKFNKGKINNN
tara:strand:- start:205 stop:399 length:195 start_codon:yes stop_codon:yes gene_type:complete